MNHPLFQSRPRLAAWWLIWALLALGQLFIYNIVYERSFQITVPDVILSFVIYSGIGLVIWYPFRYFNTKALKLHVLVANIVIMGFVAVILWILLSNYSLIFIIREQSVLKTYWTATFPFRLGSGIFIYGMVILAYYLIISLSDLAEKKAREARLESVIRETELKMLRSQINPHFLFNTLNSISSLTLTDPEKARAMVIKLSDFMRYALSRKDEQPVTLSSELSNMRLYLDIEKVRFGRRLHYEEIIDENSLNIKIPVLLLQPLYENAVKYGVHETTGDVTIATKVICGNDFVEISVSNNVETIDPSFKGTGTGLANVSKRLELYYSGKASLRTAFSEGVFTATLLLPHDKEK